MSDEEKKAVEWFKEDLIKEKEEMRYYNEYKKQVIKRNEILLNLIGNQQKEIEELMKICDSYKSASNHCAEIFSDTINPNYISKDKIRKKLKKLRREENKIYKLDYELEPEKAIDCLLLRIGDLEELLGEDR